MDLLYMEFGRLLRQSRTNAGLTQSQVAERVGLSRTSITNMEKGRQHVLLHQLFLLASAVGVTPSDLLPHGRAALEELLPQRAIHALPENAQDRDFVVRVLGKSQALELSRQAASE
jgi:transcriptional regulator with XRE-family HTH domain